jgi:saccharopine dehydrogenase-like NADP-dependent oxidoreductase
LLNGQFAVLNAGPFYLTIGVAEAARAAGTHYLDLTEDVVRARRVRELAVDASSAFIPQCGLAPGFVSIVAFDMTKRFKVLDSVKLRVGALPLKQPNGHLTVRWRLKTMGEDGKPWLHLDWKESGVEMPPSPQATGQGRELIERALPYQFGAQTTLVMEPDGVHCTISLPVSEHETADAF